MALGKRGQYKYCRADEEMGGETQVVAGQMGVAKPGVKGESGAT